MNRLLLVVALVILSGLTPERLASHAAPNPVLIPPLPASFYGTVKVSGADAPEGTPVSAWINEVMYAATDAFTFDGQSMYAIDVPADDPATPERDGGRPDDTIAFHVGGLKAEQTAVWHGGTNTELDLTATSIRLFLPLVSRIGTQGD